MIAERQVPLGSPESAELIDSLAAAIGLENEKRRDEDALQALIALGYSPSESLSAISKLGDVAGMTSDQILSLALRRKVN